MLLSDHLSLPDFVESFFPQVACASSLNLSSFWVVCVVHATCWSVFQSPFFGVLGASGHAGYLGWCVVSGQCDLWAWGEQWVCKSQWSLSGMAEGCSGESQEILTETLWVWCSSPLAVWLPELFLPEDVSASECESFWRTRRFFLNLQFDPITAFVFTAIRPRRDLSQLLFLVCLEPVSYIVSIYLADFIKHELFKTKCFMLVSVTMPWRNSVCSICTLVLCFHQILSKNTTLSAVFFCWLSWIKISTVLHEIITD